MEDRGDAEVIQAKLGSLAKAGTKGKKRSASLKIITQPINRHLIGPENGGATTVQHIAESVAAAYGGNPTIHYGAGNKGWVGDVPKFTYNVSHLAALGWRPSLSSDGAIERAVLEIVSELKTHSHPQ